MDGSTFLTLVATCAPLVHPVTASALVSVESSFNPHAIGVVGGVLERQPRNRTEAIVTAHALEASGWTYSVGLAQINARSFARLGLDAVTAFDPCRNLAAMQLVLSECLLRYDARRRRHCATRCPATTAATASPVSGTATCSAS